MKKCQNYRWYVPIAGGMLVLTFLLQWIGPIEWGKQPQTDQLSARIPFVPNQGQFDDRITFAANFSGGVLMIDEEGNVIYEFSMNGKEGGKSSWVIREDLNQNGKNDAAGKDMIATKVHYFIGNQPDKWKSDIETFNTVSLGQIAKGIEASLKVNGSNIEKIFTVSPGADPSAIAVSIEGAEKLNIEPRGNLALETEEGAITFTKPVAYQETDGEKRFVAAEYKILSDSTYGFSIGEYDSAAPLIIDPLLASTFLGGSNFEGTPEVWGGGRNMVIATDPADSNEYVYVTGYTDNVSGPPSPAFPTTTGPHGPTGSDDIFVTKLDLNLASPIIASTLLGGISGDYESVIDADQNGNIFVAGNTYSSDFPTTVGAFDTGFNGNRDGFIVKLNPALSTLQASTFIGGTTYDHVNSIDVTSSGLVYVGMDINDPDNAGAIDPPVGAYDTTGSTQFADAFVARLDNSLSNTPGNYYATFIGSGTYYTAVQVDSAGNVFVNGGCNGSSFPIVRADAVTPVPSYDETTNGSCDTWVARFNSTLTSLEASTLLGGAGWEMDFTNNLTIYGSGASERIIVGGDTNNAASLRTYVNANPNTLNAPIPYHCPGGNIANCLSDDLFVASFNSDLQTAYVTIIGGGQADNGPIVATDSSGNIYLAGSTYSTDFPASTTAYQASAPGAGEVILSKFSGTLSLRQATYLGGAGWDSYPFGMMHNGSALFITGETNSSDFPITGGAAQTTYAGGGDFFVTKLSDDLRLISGTTPAAITNLAASAGTLEIALAWSEPADGGDAITGYTIRYGESSGSFVCDPLTAPYTNCSSTTSATANKTVTGLSYGVTYIFAVYAENSYGFGPASNTVTETPGCDTTSQFCASQVISSSTLTFVTIPESFSFGEITAGSIQDMFNNNNTVNPPGPSSPGADLLQVFDDRGSGGFTVDIDTAGTFSDGTHTIPLTNLYVVTSLDETNPENGDPGQGEQAGVTYDITIPSAQRTVTAPAYADMDTKDLANRLTYTDLGANSQFGSTPLTLMNGTLPLAQGRNGNMSQFVNFHLRIPSTQAAGNYDVILTYTLSDSTTP